MAYYLQPDDWLWLIRNAGSLYAGVYNKFLPQNIISKLKRNYVLNTPSVNWNCCCTPGPIAIACQMSSPNPILAFSIDPDSVQCSRICRGWEQSSSSSGLSESCTLCKQSSKAWFSTATCSRMSTGLQHFGWSHLFVWITEPLVVMAFWWLPCKTSNIT